LLAVIVAGGVLKAPFAFTTVFPAERAAKKLSGFMVSVRAVVIIRTRYRSSCVDDDACDLEAVRRGVDIGHHTLQEGISSAAVLDPDSSDRSVTEKGLG
jgi:hypothetical protein